jgi:ferrous iron transport protein B
VVGAVALTLFLPCIAQFLMTAKERGWRTSLAMSGAVLVIAFGVAFVVFRLLAFLQLTL